MKAVILIAGLGVFAMLAEVFKLKRIVYYLVQAGLFAAVVINFMELDQFRSYFNDMVLFDNYALIFSSAILGIAALWSMMSTEFLTDQKRTSDLHSLILFSLVGAIFMVSYSNLSMLFIGIEMLSIPLYVLAASDKTSLESNESGFKYFLMGAFATGFLLFGIAFLYGVTGSFDINEISAVVRQGTEYTYMLAAGIFLIMIGLCFKVAAFPFHFWVPDVYEGAPTKVTAFMATIVKAAAFAAFLRLFYHCFASVSDNWTNLLWLISALSIVLGNVLAVYQDNMKRLLAYSSIAHAGYMLMAVVAVNQDSSSAMLLYAVAYGVASLLAFAFISIVASHVQDENISSIKGLAKENPLAAFCMTIAMLSMAGIPPVAGFFAKYYMFYTALQEHYIYLLIIAVVGSLVGVYYYFRIIIAMYSPSELGFGKIVMNGSQKVFFLIITALLILLGLAPNLLIDLL